MAVTFTTTIFQAEGKNATGISIPAEVMAALGTHQRPALVVSLNGYSYRTTVGVYGESFLIPVSSTHREASGLKSGSVVEVTLELDLEPRTVEIPEDLAAALSEKPGSMEVFQKLAPSRLKEFVRQVEDAKTQETRDRRIAGIVAKLGEA